MKDINDKDEYGIRSYLYKHINDYISPYMMRIIKEYNIDDSVKEEQIIEGYISLISNFIKAKKSLDNNNNKA